MNKYLLFSKTQKLDYTKIIFNQLCKAIGLRDIIHDLSSNWSPPVYVYDL